MPKATGLLYKWVVYFRADGSDLSIPKGTKWAPTEASACNKVRTEVWGKKTPYDHIDGALFAERVEGCPPIPKGYQPRPIQRPLL